jgi:hypothetical protein
MILRACHFEFKFPRPVIVMGIVNVTPDSFFDGGRFLDPKAAIDHALRLADEGAEIIDIGGESTRPDALPVSESEELRRVLPVLDGLSGRLKVALSIDTQKAGVARSGLLSPREHPSSMTSLRTAPMKRCGRSSLSRARVTWRCTCRERPKQCRKSPLTRMSSVRCRRSLRIAFAD